MRALKICLWIAGFACMLSVFGMFLPVSAIETITKFFGIESLPDSPQFMYAVRLMSGTYAAVGVFFYNFGPATYEIRSNGTVLRPGRSVRRRGLCDSRTVIRNAPLVVHG